MIEDSADRDETTPQSSGGGGAASPGEGELRSGATGAGADAPAMEAGSDEQTMASERGSPAGVSPSRGRRILVLVLIWVTTVLAVLGIFAVWANRQLLNPDNWANTSGQLLENNDVRTGLTNYLSAQLKNNVNGSRLKAILPPALQPLATPVAAAFQNLAVTAAQRALDSQAVQTAWKSANRVADQSLVDIVNGGSKNIQITGGVVTLNLAPLVTNLTDSIGLPNLASKLPPNAAHLKILKSNQLKLVQDIGKALKGLALLLTIIVPVLYALAMEQVFAQPVVESRLSYCTRAGGFSERVVPMTEPARRRGLEVLSVIDRSIAHGFLPPAPRDKACGTCDFRPVCGPLEERRIADKDPRPLEDLALLRSWP